MSTYRRVDDNRAPEAYDNCPDFLEKYLNYLSVFENKKPGSVMETCISLREFFQFTHYCNVIHEKPSTSDAHKDMDITQMQLSEICQVTESDIEVYLCFLDTVTHNVMSTISKKLSYIRSFYSYLERNAPELGICLSEGNPALRIPNPKPAKADATVAPPMTPTGQLLSCICAGMAAQVWRRSFSTQSQRCRPVNAGLSV